ncbi:MAG: hypothetical protein JSW46_19400 [Gemmatimonadota bacterium]|nr:MAG: hypothetical protein JSW46_19400 [Gemmatimonadota bacterium]
MNTARRICLALLVLFPATAPAARGQDIVELARRRHYQPDSTLLDYTSRLNTLVSAALSTDPLAPPKLLVASELASSVTWDRDAGLQVKMLGQRYVTSFGPEAEAGLDFSRPWFVATAPGDSLRLLGGIEIPERAAVHPFSQGADRYYEYEVGDTVTLYVADRQVDLVEVKVTPTRGDESLVVGSVWVDGASGDVGAMQIRFVGRRLWDEDEEDAEWVNRILSVSATLQQGLWEQRYWLPHHQEVELMVRIPFIGNLALPIIFRNEFDRYDVNSGQSIAWLSPDSMRAGIDTSTTYDEGATLYLRAGREVETADEVPDSARGREANPRRETTQIRAGPADGGWEIIRPPDDSLETYDEWAEPLETPAELTLPSAEELERRARSLSNEIVGRKMFVIQWDRLADLIRYNRVESLALGLAARYDIPRRAFWSIGGRGSFGFADLQPKARLDVRYDAPRMRVELTAYSELHVAASTLSDVKRAFGNSLRAFFLGRDDADYYRATGVALTLDRRWSWFRGRIGAGFEDHTTVERNTDFAIPGIWQDSVFQLNPPADEGIFWRGDGEAIIYLGDWTRPTDRGQITVGVEAGTGADSLDYVQARAGLEGKVDLWDLASLALVARGGWSGGEVPLQRLWRIGGIATLRGFTHGTLAGESYWTGRIELAKNRPIWRPVVFADFGWAGNGSDWPGGGSSDDVLWSVGGGVSLLNGFFRAELVSPKFEKVWFEMYFAGAL